MKSRLIAVGGSAFALCLAAGTTAQAGHVEQISLKEVFNADVIVNGSNRSGVDTTQNTMDTDGNAFVTQGAAKALDSCQQDPDGLPNSGKFTRNRKHPAVKLGYSNSKNGLNARGVVVGDTFQVDVPPGKYRQVHVFASSGEGSSDITVTENYAGGASDVNGLVVWDWFDSQPEFGYPLARGMDRARADASQCFDDDGATIWGFKMTTDESARLNTLEIARTDQSFSSLYVFGVTGVRAGSH